MKKTLLFLWAFCGSNMNVVATVDVPDFHSVPWGERTYETVLPQSFGDVTVNVRSQGDGEVKSIMIEALGEEILVPSGQLVGIEQLGEPDLAIANEGGENEELRIFFEYGFPVRTQADSNSEWMRPVLAIAINRKGKIKVARETPNSLEQAEAASN